MLSKTAFTTMTECYDFGMSDRSTLRSGKRAAISNLYLKSQFFELFHELEHYPLFHSSILWAVNKIYFED